MVELGEELLMVLLGEVRLGSHIQSLLPLLFLHHVVVLLGSTLQLLFRIHSPDVLVLARISRLLLLHAKVAILRDVGVGFKPFGLGILNRHLIQFLIEFADTLSEFIFLERLVLIFKSLNYLLR